MKSKNIYTFLFQLKIIEFLLASEEIFYLPPSNIISMLPLFSVEVLAVILIFIYVFEVIYCPNTPLGCLYWGQYITVKSRK